MNWIELNWVELIFNKQPGHDVKREEQQLEQFWKLPMLQSSCGGMKVVLLHPHLFPGIFSSLWRGKKLWEVVYLHQSFHWALYHLNSSCTFDFYIFFSSLLLVDVNSRILAGANPISTKIKVTACDFTRKWDCCVGWKSLPQPHANPETKDFWQEKIIIIKKNKPDSPVNANMFVLKLSFSGWLQTQSRG